MASRQRADKYGHIWIPTDASTCDAWCSRCYCTDERGDKRQYRKCKPKKKKETRRG